MTNYQVKNLRTGRTTKDAISGRPVVFASKQDAEIAAASLNCFARVDEKRNRYVVVVAA